jgi:hypothetical protein
MVTGLGTGHQSFHLHEKKVGNVEQWVPHSRFLTTQLLPCSTSPALFRQSHGVFVIPLETRTLSSSCTTCITSVLDAAWTFMLNVARVVLAVSVLCRSCRRHSRCGNTCITARSLSDLDVAFERCHNALEIRRRSFTRLILSFKTIRTRLACRNSSQESRIPSSAQQRKLHRHQIWSEFRNPVLSQMCPIARSIWTPSTLMRPYKDTTELLQRPKSKARHFLAKDVLVGLNGTCRVRGCDGLDSRTNGTPGGTTALDTQKVELSCANSCAKEDRTFGIGLSLQSCISKETK